MEYMPRNRASRIFNASTSTRGSLSACMAGLGPRSGDGAVPAVVVTSTESHTGATAARVWDVLVREPSAGCSWSPLVAIGVVGTDIKTGSAPSKAS